MLDRREQDIVGAAQRGNKNAFGELVQRYQNLVTSIAFSRTGDLQRSEDIAQQAFLVAWEKRAELRDPRRFGGWLRAITRNVTLNSNRKSRRLDRSATALDSINEPASIDLPEDRLASQEQQSLLWASLKNIPEDYREPLVLFYREDKSVKQVAEHLGLSIDVVKQRLVRGRAMLKSEVEQFVEDLLGSTKPSTSFTSAVMALLPSATAATGNAIVKGGLFLGAKTMLAKLGFLATGSFLGAMGGVLGGAIGVWAGWYGTKTAERYATSVEEKRLLWWFFRTILWMTILMTVLSLAVAFSSVGDYVRIFWVVGSTVVYSIVLGGMIVHFIKLQTKLHDQFGKPSYVTDGALAAASPFSFRISVLSASTGGWVWVFVLAGLKQDWIVIAIAFMLWLGHLAWLLANSDSQRTAPDQLRFQAKSLFMNALLACSLVLVAGFIGTKFDYAPVANWMISFVVCCICWLLAGFIWHLGNESEKRFAKENLRTR